MTATPDDDVLPSELLCSRCGMQREDWSGNRGRGVIALGEVYCCQGCADDAGCTCDNDRDEPEEDEALPELKPRRGRRASTSPKEVL